MKGQEIAKTSILSPPSLYRADMNSHNSSTNAQKTVPSEYPSTNIVAPLLRNHRFIEGVGMAV
jgi:hypothetical protein